MKIFYIFAICCIGSLLANNCVHEEKQREVTVESSNENLSNERELLGINNSPTHPIRIHFDTRYLKNVEEKYRVYIEKQLLPFAKSKCYEVVIPEEHKTTGVDADLLIYVTAGHFNENFGAWAITCQRDWSLLSRPVAGQINFNTKFIYFDKETMEAKMVTTLHELTHILAFSPSHYYKYRDSNGNMRKYSDVIKSVNWRGFDTKIITTPKVLEVSRKHFNCDSIQGMELENQGSSGSAGAHWERTILHNEAMTASNIHNRAYSKFTMALLEDSGWYKINSELIEPFYWGEGQGCEFISKGCQGRDFREFCHEEGKEMCDFHYSGKGKCRTDSFGDNCKYVNVGRGGDCSSKTGSNNHGEIFSGKSKCLSSSLLKKNFFTFFSSYFDDDISPRCYEYSCSKDHSQIEIILSGGKRKTCRYKGEKIRFDGYYGELVCPNAKDFCKDFYPNCKNYCSGHGYCVNGKCECNPGRTGEDCSVQEEVIVCPNNCSGNGICYHGVCYCNSGLKGTDCSLKS